MKNLHKNCRRHFSHLSFEEIDFLCQSFGVSKEEETIVIDSYKNRLSDKVLTEKHFCSRASLVRTRKIFWRRVESISLVPGLISPHLKLILNKLLFIFFGYFIWWRTIIFFDGFDHHEQIVFPPKKFQLAKASTINKYLLIVFFFTFLFHFD